MNIKEFARNFLRKSGYEINAYNFLRSHEVRRNKFLHDQKISLVLDVGANEGQYGSTIRNLGYNGNIISFEPVESVFQTLIQKSHLDSKWTTRKEALGNFDGYTAMNISDFSQVSSILSATGLADTTYWKGKNQEKVRVRQLDSLIDDLEIDAHRVWLKIDTQGFEENVLRGCQELMKKDNLLFLEVELSVRQFYSGEKLFFEMLGYIRDFGFEIVSMQPVHVDAMKGYILQYDCILVRKNILDT